MFEKSRGLNLRWASVIVLITFLIFLLPVVFFCGQDFFGIQVVVDSEISIVHIILWGFLATINLFVVFRGHLRLTGTHKRVYLSYVLLSFLPVLGTGLWLFSGPYIHSGSFILFVNSYLISLGFLALINYLIFHFSTSFRWPEFITFFVSFFSTLVCLIVVTNSFHEEHKRFFGNDRTASNREKTYWFYVNKLGGDGRNKANSFGFLGPEPDLAYNGTRVLLVGDSIPAAGNEITFSKLAEKLLIEEGWGGRIINASIPSFSLEQIKKYYLEKLEDIPYDLLVVCFYIDDINRELRFRKNNYLYTPSWPEWMQDIYYQYFLVKKILNQVGFTDKTFLWYRRNSYREAFPHALKTLGKIRENALARNSTFAIFNVPRFNWQGKLASKEDYMFTEFNLLLEEWCLENDTPYFDLLPTLSRIDIDEYRISPTNIHFNDSGHRMVGVELKKFVSSLLSREKIIFNANTWHQ